LTLIVVSVYKIPEEKVMFKKILSFLVVLVMLSSVLFLVSAGEVSISISDSSGSAVVTVSQAGTNLFTGAAGFNGAGTVTSNDTDGLLVSVGNIPSYYYSTINSTLAQSTTLPAGSESINVSIVKFTPPSISLSINSKGGVSYEVSANSPISVFEIEVFENNVSVSVFSTTSGSGSISSVTEGKSYTAAARINGLGYSSEYGDKSNSVTVPSSYSLIVKGTDGGTINDISDSYIVGTKLTLTATASSGYSFIEWTSSGSGEFEDKKAKETTFTMPAQNVTVTATFSKTYKFVIMSSTGGKVWDVDGSYYEGQGIKISAIPGDGYTFDSWVSSDGGKFEDSRAVATVFTMPANATTVTATFKESSGGTTTEPPKKEDTDDTDTGMYEIKTSVVGNGNIVINQSKAHEGQKITVRATAQAGYTFDSWSCEGGGDFLDVNAAATTFNMPDSDATIIATFIKVEGSTATTDKTPDVVVEKKSSNSLFIIVGIAIVVVAAVVVGIILVMKEKARRQAYYDDDNSYFTNYEEEQTVYDYDNEQNESQSVEEQDTSNWTDNKGSASKSWRQQRKRRTQYSDNVYRADDWDE